MAAVQSACLVHAFGGVDYTFTLDMNTLCAFEEKTGKEALSALDVEDITALPSTDMRALLWALMNDAHPDLTDRDVGKLIGLDFEAVGVVLTTVFAKAMPSAADVKKPTAGGKAKAVDRLPTE
jgi:hypothetical protein